MYITKDGQTVLIDDGAWPSFQADGWSLDQDRNAEADSTAGGDTSGLLPIADPTGVTIETAPNTIKGSGTYDVITFPADTVALAFKLEGDDFPRVVFPADPNDYGALFMGDGTYDPLGSGPAGIWFSGYFLRSGGFSTGATTIDGVGNRITIDDSNGGLIQRSPSGTHHRVVVADDGTLSTEVVA